MQRNGAGLMCSISIALLLATSAWCQSSTQESTTTQTSADNHEKAKKTPGPGREIGNGAGDVAAGAAKGAGSLAKGTAKGAGDLATLHPIDAGVDLGKGAVGAGKNVGVGTAKGTGKVVKGIGKAFKHIL